MEWVEVRGENVAAAEELALDQLGVARDDAEFEIVQEPESKWLGFRKTEARVRARVRPTAPPPKTERRNRRSRRGKGSGDQGQGGQNQGGGNGGRNRQKQNQGGGNRGGQRNKNQGNQNQSKGGQESSGGNGGRNRNKNNENRAGADSGGGQRGNGRGAQQGAAAAAAAATDNGKPEEKAVTETREAMPVKEQQEHVTSFLQGIIDGFGVEATALTTMDDDTVVGSIDGSDVGLLIGPRAGTLRAIQELARTSMQREAQGRDTNRLVIDVAGYLERRKAALVAFTAKQAEQVRETGESIALEPMTSADRKIVHDAAGELDGIRSSSAGEDPRRHVVLHPADD